MKNFLKGVTLQYEIKEIDNTVEGFLKYIPVAIEKEKENKSIVTNVYNYKLISNIKNKKINDLFVNINCYLNRKREYLTNEQIDFKNKIKKEKVQTLSEYEKSIPVNILSHLEYLIFIYDLINHNEKKEEFKSLLEENELDTQDFNMILPLSLYQNLKSLVYYDQSLINEELIFKGKINYCDIFNNKIKKKLLTFKINKEIKELKIFLNLYISEIFKNIKNRFGQSTQVIMLLNKAKFTLGMSWE